MTGQYAAFGQFMRAGADEAVANLNRGAGLSGRRVNLLVEDDGCDKARAIAVAARLVAKRVALVAGHYCASASLAAAPIYAAAGVIMISPGTTDPLLTDKRAGPSVFRLAWRDDAQGQFASGAYLAQHFGGKRVAILHDRTEAGIRLAIATKKTMNAAGVVEVLHAGFIAGERDYAQLARDLRVRQVDAVYLGAYPREAHLIYTALRASGQTTAVLGSHLLANAATESRPGTLSDGLLVASIPGAEKSAGIGNVISANTRAAIEVWSQATEGYRTTPVAIQDGSFATVLGNVRFDKKGDAKVPYFKILVWRGGELVPAPQQ